jgi:hypothetical protein
LGCWVTSAPFRFRAPASAAANVAPLGRELGAQGEDLLLLGGDLRPQFLDPHAGDLVDDLERLDLGLVRLRVRQGLRGAPGGPAAQEREQGNDDADAGSEPRLVIHHGTSGSS